MTEHQKLGSGVSLDEQWDLYVDESTGDFSDSSGAEEALKDLAFQVGRLLTGVVGTYIDDEKRADIQLSVQRLIINDPRISEIPFLDVRTPDSRPDTLEIEVRAVTVEGETIEDVFTVGL